VGLSKDQLVAVAKVPSWLLDGVQVLQHILQCCARLSMALPLRLSVVEAATETPVILLIKLMLGCYCGWR
jgi:hypothetical protein